MRCASRPARSRSRGEPKVTPWSYLTLGDDQIGGKDATALLAKVCRPHCQPQVSGDWRLGHSIVSTFGGSPPRITTLTVWP